MLQAGNVTAQYVLAKIILVTSSQLWERTSEDLIYYFAPYFPIDQAGISGVAEKDTAAFFMAHFMADQASTSNRSGGRLIHSELVRLFVCRCGLVDLVTMRQHLENYFRYFVKFGGSGCLKFFDHINVMSSILQSIVCVVKNRNIWYSRPILKGIPVESGKGKREPNALCIDLDGRLFYYLMKHKEFTFKMGVIHEIHAPSGSKLEELNRECKDIAELLIPGELGKGKTETNVRCIDLGERFLSYIVKHRRPMHLPTLSLES